MADKNFSDQYNKLEEILEWFESDSFDLDKADKKFDEGVKLADTLISRLDKAKLKIKTLEDKIAD